MSQIALVTPEGVPVTINERPPVVEEYKEDLPLHVRAARQHAKDSTPIKDTK